eukprot:CAMPEP_0172327954 /NCGR_PEP_ID=MMETSP1058-20130122/60102_1 /TAXON_ID=83371 /ORGANISM="Detonula confervacea, Strain CCMP 353" /LENGTH=137 /DNA_ID=CAMNT_0013045047 /DNA_START=608 /DNA_END=1022 /DNA_ORIENTATION=+
MEEAELRPELEVDCLDSDGVDNGEYEVEGERGDGGGNDRLFELPIFVNMHHMSLSIIALSISHYSSQLRQSEFSGGDPSGDISSYLHAPPAQLDEDAEHDEATVASVRSVDDEMDRADICLHKGGCMEISWDDTETL